MGSSQGIGIGAGPQRQTLSRLDAPELGLALILGTSCCYCSLLQANTLDPTRSSPTFASSVGVFSRVSATQGKL